MQLLLLLKFAYLHAFSSMPLSSEDSSSSDDEGEGSVELSSLSLSRPCSPDPVWSSCSCWRACVPSVGCCATLEQFLQRQANEHGFADLWHLHRAVRQPGLQRQPEVSDASRSSTASRLSLLAHTIVTLSIVSTLQPCMFRGGAVMLGVFACFHTFITQDDLSQWCSIVRSTLVGIDLHQLPSAR